MGLCDSVVYKYGMDVTARAFRFQIYPGLVVELAQDLKLSFLQRKLVHQLAQRVW